jgi:hypothetical protein
MHPCTQGLSLSTPAWCPCPECSHTLLIPNQKLCCRWQEKGTAQSGRVWSQAVLHSLLWFYLQCLATWWVHAHPLSAPIFPLIPAASLLRTKIHATNRAADHRQRIRLNGVMFSHSNYLCARQQQSCKLWGEVRSFEGWSWAVWGKLALMKPWSISRLAGNASLYSSFEKLFLLY